MSASRDPAPLDFDTVFASLSPFVWRALSRLGVTRADLPDASQEVFVVVHRKLGGFEGRSDVKTWVYGICVRVASAFRRRAFRVRERPLDALDGLPGAEASEPTSGPSQDADIDRRRAQQTLVRLLDRLDDAKRSVFVLYELEGLTMPEVAAAVDCPLTTAYSRLHAARDEVRAGFAREALRSGGKA